MVRLTRAYFGGVALGGVLDAGGLTSPEGGAAVVLELEASLLGGAVGPGDAEALGVVSGVEAAGAVAAALAVEPVDALDAMAWPDHQSLLARWVGDAFM